MPNSDSDILAITQLVNLYGLAVDSQQWQLFDSIFTADVDADYGGSSHWTDLAGFKSDFAAFHDPFDSTQHTMSTHVVHIDGERAHSFCNGGWRLVRKAVDGSPLWDGTGWYDDTLARTPGGDHPPRMPHHLVDRQSVRQRNDPAVKFDLTTAALPRQAEAGHVGVLKLGHQDSNASAVDRNA